MAIFKKSIIIILCATLAFSPLLYCGEFSYAVEETPADWIQLEPEDEDLIARGALLALRGMSFMYKSSPAGVATKWTYDELRRRCDSAGITMSELSQYMQYKVEGNKYSFLYRSGITALLNQLWSDMMLTYGLQANSFTTIYSGKYFTDPNGNTVLCFVTNTAYIECNRLDIYNYISGFGQKYLHSGKELKSLSNITYQKGTNDTATFDIKYSSKAWSNYTLNNIYGIGSSTNTVYSDNNTYAGYDCVIYWNNTFSLASFCDFTAQNVNTDVRIIRIQRVFDFIQSNIEGGNANVSAHQGEPKNLPTDEDYKISEPDDDEDEPVVEPFTPPGPPTDPYIPNPTGGGSTDDGNGNTDFHWQMPDINVDWDLGDFSDIFPFSIPFDIIELFDIVDSEPVTPAIYQEVDFGAFNYTIDFDLSYFDEFMEYVRAMELFLYTLTLFIATRGIFKIY